MKEQQNFKFELDVKKANSETTSKKRRPRSPTLLKLQWLAERVKKAESLRKEINDGSYRINSQTVAEAMIGKDIGKA